MNDKDNITIGLPNPKGALYWAPAGTAVPTDAVTPLPAAFVNLGYVSADGLTSTTTEESNDIVVWGPEAVGTSQTNYSRSFSFNLLESSRESALQFRYGTDNVTIDAEGGVKVNDTGVPSPRGVFVCDTLQNNGGDSPRYHRQVAGDAQLVDRSGDQVYNNSDAVSIPAVLRAFRYTATGVTKESGDFVTEFWSAPVVPTP